MACIDVVYNSHEPRLKYLGYFNRTLDSEIYPSLDRGGLRQLLLYPSRSFGRYLLQIDGLELFTDNAIFLHWDDDEGTSRIIYLELWVVNANSDGEPTSFDRIEAVSVSAHNPHIAMMLFIIAFFFTII